MKYVKYMQIGCLIHKLFKNISNMIDINCNIHSVYTLALIITFIKFACNKPNLLKSFKLKISRFEHKIKYNELWFINKCVYFKLTSGISYFGCYCKAMKTLVISCLICMG